uniref:Immunoglobulin V-set domain-containing protein n=1 Tax=Stegastes partitus TaxID=144197 RepID=A0A3B5AAK8_9TELE
MHVGVCGSATSVRDGSVSSLFWGSFNFLQFSLRCVLQVTWQRLYADESIENLATYSKRFGQQVNDPYKRKVIFTEASLSSTSISLKEVSWADESCYICSFNVYPDGSKRRQTFEAESLMTLWLHATKKCCHSKQISLGEFLNEACKLQ